MSDERELLEQEAKSKCFLEKPGGDVFMGTTEQFAPRAFAALRAVLEYADVLEKHGDFGRNVYYAEAADGIRRRITRELGESDG